MAIDDILAADPSGQIVKATDQLPSEPEGLIKPPQRLFPIDPPDILELKKMFNEARDLSAEPRKRQQKDRAYYDGPGQLLSDVRATLKMRGQPAIYTNRVRPAIDGILGVMEGAKVDPRAYPRNPDDENLADVATKTLRFIADKANFQEAKLDCAEDFWIEGDCAVIIEGSADNVSVKQIRCEEFFYDPRSRRPDFKDAGYMGFAKWMYADVVKGLYPEAYAALGDVFSGGIGLEDTWQDKPSEASQWIDRKNRRVLIVSLFYQREGEWRRCVYCAAGALDHDMTGYLDRAGRNVNPIEAASCYVAGKEQSGQIAANERYGRVRDMIPIQDEINARRSRLLHLANSRQLTVAMGSLAASMSQADLRREANKADGVFPEGAVPVPTSDLAAGQQLLLAESKTEIERMGPTPAVLGRQEAAGQSGRARLVAQQAGLTELARPMGRFDDFENRCYRQMFLRAQQLWTDPMFIRVTDDLNAPEFMKVNEPVKIGEAIEMAVHGDPKALEALGQVIPAGMLQAAQQGDQQAILIIAQYAQMNPEMVVMIKNRLAELDVDIIVSTSPDTANMQQEEFAELMDLLTKAGGLAAIFSEEFEFAVEMSSLQEKGKFVEKLKKRREQQAEQMQAQQAEAVKAQQIAEASAIADIENKNAGTAKIAAETDKTRTETLLMPIDLANGHAV